LHDTSGVVLATRDGGVTWQRVPTLLPAIHKVRFVSDRQGWAIGCSSSMYPSGVFLTRDAGRSWQPATAGGAIGLTAGDLYDGRKAILGGSQARLATINADDFTQRRLDSSSESILPYRGIHAMQTVPPSYGWLVGDGGWIALTGDGGNSWRPPLGKLPGCAALLAVAGRPSDLPMGLLARICKDQGYFGVGESIGREDVDSASASDASPCDCLHQAMLEVGACGGEMAWGFPVLPAVLQLPPA